MWEKERVQHSGLSSATLIVEQPTSSGSLFSAAAYWQVVDNGTDGKVSVQSGRKKASHKAVAEWNIPKQRTRGSVFGSR